MVKNPPANAGEVGSVPRWGRSPGEGNGNPFQHSCLGNPWTEEPGGLWSMESQRVREDFVTKYQSYHNVNVFEKYHYISFTQSRDFLLLQDTLYAGNLWLSQST